MLEISLLRDNKKNAIKALNKRNIPDISDTIDDILSLDEKRRNSKTQLDHLQAESNMLSKEIGKLMKKGKRDDAEEKKKETSELKVRIKSLSDELTEIEQNQKELLYNVPNVPHELVPEGKGDDQNVTVHEWGESPTLNEDAAPHWELAKKFDIIDFELGNKITGAGFPVYKGKGARLQRALVNFFLDEALREGYLEIQPPVVINESSGIGTGQLPDKEGQMYQLTDENYYLIPTAEVPITNIYRDEILSPDQLPVKNVGYTPCFRREAGSWGAHVRGLNRLHQFDKVEIVQIREPEDSYEALNEMCDYVKGLLEKLEIKYRMRRLCGGDLGFTSALTYDMEVFSGAQKKWLEVSSISNFESYQSNRLKLRYKVEGKTKLLHTLNGSALALPRIVAAILENNQTDKGIRVPGILQNYTGFDMIS